MEQDKKDETPKRQPIPKGLDIFGIMNWLHEQGRHAEAYRIDNGAF